MRKTLIRIEKGIALLWAVVAWMTQPRRPRVDKGIQLPFDVLVMCGTRIKYMTRQMLWSFCYAWQAVPRKLILVSDGSMTEMKIRQFFKHWPGDIEVADWKRCVDSVDAQYRPDLDKFAQNNIFGRKLAAILHYASRGKILFCDADILWFAPLGIPSGSGFILKIMQDIEHSYNLPLIQEMGWTQLLRAKPLNVGLIYMQGDVFQADPEFARGLQALEEPYTFPEQTLLAKTALDKGSFWPDKEVFLDTADRWTLFSTRLFKSHKARHYSSGLKRKLWRDAVVLNLRQRLRFLGIARNRQNGMAE